MEVIAPEGLACQCLKLPGTANRSSLDAPIDTIVLTASNDAEISPNETLVLCDFLSLEELIKSTFESCMALLKLVKHGFVELVACVDEDGRENENFEVHEASHVGCLLFVIKIKALLRLLCHLLICSLFAQIGLLLSRELGAIAATLATLLELTLAKALTWRWSLIEIIATC